MVQNYGTSQQVTLVDTTGNPVSLNGNGSSSTGGEALQGEQVGAVQPSEGAIATSTVQEILPLSGIRKRVRITNHSPTDSILIELNGDATLTQGQIIGGNGTWESPGIEEARSRITVLSATGNNVNISYQETIDNVFVIDALQITNSNLNFADLTWDINIVGATSEISQVQVRLREEGNASALASLDYFNLIPGSTFSPTFTNINTVNGSSEQKEFYIEIEVISL